MSGEGERGREGRGRKERKTGKGRTGGAFREIKIYDYSPGHKFRTAHGGARQYASVRKHGDRRRALAAFNYYSLQG